MLRPLPAIERADAAGGGRPATMFASMTLDSQIDEAARALERAKRELAAAMANQGRQEELVAVVRRRIADMRWMNPEVAATTGVVQQIAAQAVAALNANMEAASKDKSQAVAEISALQTRIVQQYWRVTALEERRRSMSASPTRTAASEATREDDRKGVAAAPAAKAGSHRAEDEKPAPIPPKDAALADLTDLLVARALAIAEEQSRAAEPRQRQRAPRQ